MDVYFNKMNGKNPFETPDHSFVTMPEIPTKSRSTKRKKAIEKYNQDLVQDSYSGNIRESIKDERSNSRISNNTREELRTITEIDDYSDDFEINSIRESISGSFKDKQNLEPMIVARRLNFMKTVRDRLNLTKAMMRYLKVFMEIELRKA